MWEAIKNAWSTFYHSGFFKIEVFVVIFIICICIYLYFKYSKRVVKIHNYNKPLTQQYLDEYRRGLPYIRTLETEEQPTKPKKQKAPKQEWKNEARCRDIVEKLFNKKFVSIRPEFLKNPVTGKNLELDCYCEELKLAFEIDGVQHSKYTPHFHRQGVEEFLYQIKKDDFKTKKCKLEGVDLIRIPHYIAPDSLEDYIKKEVLKITRLREYCL